MVMARSRSEGRERHYNAKGMTGPAIKELEAELDDVVSQLKASKDPDTMRSLLAQMRLLMAERERLVSEKPNSTKT